MKNFCTRTEALQLQDPCQLATRRTKLAEICWKRSAPLAEAKRSLGGAGMQVKRTNCGLRTAKSAKATRDEPWRGIAPASRDPDWVLLPVNRILCDGLAAERHEWVTTLCATHTNITPNRHPCRRHFGPSLGRPGALAAAPGPRLAFLCSVYWLSIAKIGALTRGAVMGGVRSGSILGSSRIL